MKGRIKEIRKFVKKSQTEFGKEIGVSLSSVQKWESGENTPTQQVQYVICDKYGISRHWLETGEGDMIDPQIGSDIELLTRSMEGQSEAKKKFLRIIAGMPDDLLDAVLAHLEKSLDTKNTP